MAHYTERSEEFKRNMAEAKKPRETTFGDPEIINDEQAIRILNELSLITFIENRDVSLKLTRAIEYLRKRLESRIADPEQESK